MALLLWSFACETALTDVSLSGEWEFRYDPENRGLDEKWYEQEETWEQNMAVPGFWDDDSYDGAGWFRRSFSVGRANRRDHLGLIFESVDDNATVWLNGEFLGSHEGYGQLFWFEVTPKVNRDSENILAVRIEDTGGPGGINGDIRILWYDDEKALLQTRFSRLAAVEPPNWVHEAILYEIFVRNFSESEDFDGIMKKLDDIEALGVDCIWLMPIHPIGEKNRKGEWGSPYSPADYYGITPDYGTSDDLRRLVEETHKRGMKIILDMVLNHSAWDNPLLSSHPDWYTRNDHGEVVPPNADWWDVADFNYDSPELRSYMIEMLGYWVKEYDVDGFRFDVAELVPVDFWIDARRKLKLLKPDILFLAEGDHPQLHVEAFDLSYSWNVWHHVIEVTNGRKNVEALGKTLENEQYRYPRGSVRMRFVENHDKLRAAGVIPPRALKVAHAFIYTIEGVPLLYNGEEVALTRRPDLFEKDPLNWSAGDDEFRDFMITLGGLKKRVKDLSSGEFQIIEGDFPGSVMAWKRGNSVLCLANFADEEYTVTLGKDEAGGKINLARMRLEFSVSGDATFRSDRQGAYVGLKPWDLVVLVKTLE